LSPKVTQIHIDYNVIFWIRKCLNGVRCLNINLYKQIIKLPKVAVQKWKEKLSRGEKIAAKLEFKKNNIVELHIIDEREHIFILSGFNKKSE